MEINREVYTVSDLTPEGSKFAGIGAQLQEHLSILGIDTMLDVADLALELLKTAEYTKTIDNDGNLAYTPQINIEVDTSDFNTLWNLHEQLQASAVVAFGLWQNNGFKVHTGSKIDTEGLFGITTENEYLVFQRATNEDAYMQLFFTYINQGQQVRSALKSSTTS